MTPPERLRCEASDARLICGRCIAVVCHPVQPQVLSATAMLVAKTLLVLILVAASTSTIGSA